MLVKKCHLCGGKISGGRCTDCGMKDESSPQVVREEPVQRREQEKAPKPKKEFDGKRIQGIFKIILPVAVVLNAVAGKYFSQQDHVESNTDNLILATIDNNLLDKYSHIERELSQEGESVQITLKQGNYEVGVDLPEGTYRITDVSGQNWFLWDDQDNSIYENIFIADYQWEDDVRENNIEEIHLYNEAKINIEEDLELTMASDNVQVGENKQ